MSSTKVEPAFAATGRIVLFSANPQASDALLDIVRAAAPAAELHLAHTTVELLALVDALQPAAALIADVPPPPTSPLVTHDDAPNDSTSASAASTNATPTRAVAPSALIASLRGRSPRPRIIILDTHDDSEHVVACFHAGADDFVSLRKSDFNGHISNDPHAHHHAPIIPRLVRALAAAAPGSASSSPVSSPVSGGTRNGRYVDTRFKTLADSAPALVWITDNNGSFIHFNRSWLDFTGRSLAEEEGEGWLNGVFPEDRARLIQEFNDCIARRSTFRQDFRLRRNDGLYRWVTSQGIPHYEENGDLTGYIGSCLDITDQHEAETRLAFRAITQAALAGFGRYALGQHTLPEIKQEATRLICDTLRLTYSEVLLYDSFEPDRLQPGYLSGFSTDFTHAKMSAAVAREAGDQPLLLDDDSEVFPGRENHRELGVRNAIAIPLNDGRGVVGFLTGLSSDPRGFGREAFDFIQAIGTIITTVHQRTRAELALQESEHKLLQSQKMEAVGQLAGGVAHDFNNLLTAVRCYGDMLHEDLAMVAPELRAKTAEILKAAARASALTRQLLAFSRKQVLQPEVLDMNGVIGGLRDLVRSLLSENVSLEVNLAENEACFEADRNQVDQVVLNLCLNARDAMPQGGVLTLTVASFTAARANKHNLAPGRYVELVVSDNGIGMDKEVQSRLFQPFFTTKPVGRGTGLGLATCAVIVKNCNGVITFQSQLGKGTRFHLFLPQIDAPRAGFFAEAEEAVVTGAERILVVEDDEAIRHITHAILDSLGYQVTVVTGSVEAISLYESASKQTFDLLLTDVIMPEMHGLELARYLHKNHQPGLRTMFMSGYVGNTETVQAVEDCNLPFLEKPFTLNALARKVRETLDSPPANLVPPA